MSERVYKCVCVCVYVRVCVSEYNWEYISLGMVKEVLMECKSVCVSTSESSYSRGT